MLSLDYSQQAHILHESDNSTVSLIFHMPTRTYRVCKTIRTTAAVYKVTSREHVILRKLKSELIVNYFEDFLSEGCTNIIMEFCPGGDLRNLIQRKQQAHDHFSQVVCVVSPPNS